MTMKEMEIKYQDAIGEFGDGKITLTPEEFASYEELIKGAEFAHGRHFKTVTGKFKEWMTNNLEVVYYRGVEVNATKTNT